jgi:chemotaxis protein MotB
LDEDDSEKNRYFIILYAISNIDLLKYENVKQAMESSFGSGKIVGLEKRIPGLEVPADKLKDHLIKLINDNGYGNVIKLEENQRGITIHILDEILFTSGEAELSKSSLSVLNNIAGILKDIPNDIRIEGHTDNVPINTAKFPSNWHLSVMRALNTAYYLVNSEKLQPDRVSIVGYSEYKPIATNFTPEGRTLNRRVDILIIRK